MEFKFRGLKVSLPDGVEAPKFDANRVIASIPEEVYKLFQGYGIDLKEECPGAFIKGFTLNEKELVEVSENLKRYQELGLIDIIKANPKNLQIRVFKSTFMKRLVERLQAGQPYLNSDNSFADFLLKNEIEQKNESVVNSVIDKTYDFRNEAANEQNNDKTMQMSPENKQVYNEIVESLNYLVLANPMDTMLATVVNNSTAKVVDAINREEYRYIGIKEMVKSVMFEGLEVPSTDKERLENLVLGAFPDEERKER